MNNANPPAQSNDAPVKVVGIDGKKIFTVGTLTYTTAGLVTLFFWLLFGDFAMSLRDRSVGPITEKFLLSLGTTNTTKQLLLSSLPLLIALVVQPVVSYQSDRLRGKWGRRIPYLLYPTPIAAIMMLGIAFCPQIATQLAHIAGHDATTTTQPAVQALQGLPTVAGATQGFDAVVNRYTLVLFTIFWTVFEVCVLISAAVMGGLINDVVPRPVLGRFFGLFRAVSLFDGIIFNWFLFRHVSQHFTLMFGMIALVFGGGFLLMCLKVKEGEYPPVPAEPNAPRGFFGVLAMIFLHRIPSYFRECFSHPYYLLLFAMFTLGALTFRPINDFTIRYAGQLGMSDEIYGKLVGGSYIVSLVLAFPLGMAVDKFHVLRMAMFSLVLYLISSVYGALFIHDTVTFGIALVAHTVLSGTYFTCTASMGQILFPRSKFAQYASAGGLVTSLTVLGYSVASGIVIDATGNNYKLTFVAGLVLSVITLALLVLVYRSFIRLGGYEGYIAPGDEPPESVPTRGFPVLSAATGKNEGGKR